MNRFVFVVLCSVTASIAAQQPLGPTFEVTSVRLHTSDDQRTMMTMQPGGRFVALNIPLRHVIRGAYSVQDDQIVGAPSWIDTDRFDINAKAHDDIRPEQIAPMIQALLADRFKLTTHRDMRELPVLALGRVRRDGPISAGLRLTACPELAVDLNERKPCANISNGVNFLTMRGAPIAVFAQYLAPYVNRIVVDRTGLNGRYDIVLKWSPEQQQTPKDDLPSLFTALQEQLGLKFESSKGMVDVLVIDSVERPAPD
jgi:uncharacterized protein (TIGR03435 family)